MIERDWSKVSSIATIRVAAWHSPVRRYHSKCSQTPDAAYSSHILRSAYAFTSQKTSEAPYVYPDIRSRKFEAKSRSLLIAGFLEVFLGLDGWLSLSTLLLHVTIGRSPSPAIIGSTNLLAFLRQSGLKLWKETDDSAELLNRKRYTLS